MFGSPESPFGLKTNLLRFLRVLVPTSFKALRILTSTKVVSSFPEKFEGIVRVFCLYCLTNFSPRNLCVMLGMGDYEYFLPIIFSFIVILVQAWY